MSNPAHPALQRIPSIDATTFLFPEAMAETSTTTSLPVRGLSVSYPAHAKQTEARRPSATPSLASAKGIPAPTKPSTAERNIDNVVFGDVMFRAWYPSPYVKEVVGKEVIEERKIRGLAASGGAGNVVDSVWKVDGAHTNGYTAGGGPIVIGGKGLQPDGTVSLMLERLFVCRWCFAYTRHVGEAVGHRRSCERQPGQRLGEDGWGVPGRKIYTHPLSKAEKMKRGAGKGQGVWSVWEVDGEVDTVTPIFCDTTGSCTDIFTALLPVSFTLRQTLPRQQIRLF